MYILSGTTRKKLEYYGNSMCEYSLRKKHSGEYIACKSWRHLSRSRGGDYFARDFLFAVSLPLVFFFAGSLGFGGGGVGVLRRTGISSPSPSPSSSSDSFSSSSSSSIFTSLSFVGEDAPAAIPANCCIAAMAAAAWAGSVGHPGI